MTATIDRDAERPRIRDRWAPSAPNLVWLAIGLAALLLSVGGRWSLPLAAWMAPIFLLRFSRRSRPLVAIAGLAVVSFLQMLWLGVEWNVDLNTNALTTSLTFVLGLVLIVPYVADRLIGARLNPVGRLLLFPAAWAAVEFIVGSSLPVGTSIGVRAATQGEDLALVQIVSFTGAYGIGFLIAAGASVANHVWENPFRDTLVRWGGGFLAAMVVVVGYGEARLSLAARSTGAPTVKVAGITPPPDLRAEAAKLVTPANSPPSPETTAALATSAMKALYAQITEQMLTETRQAARAGAQVVVWSETAAPTLEADKPALLQEVAAVARAEGVYIDAAIGVPFERNETFLFSPTGAELWHYQKNHPVPGLEPVAPVTNDPPVIDTPLGRLSNVICFDGDFPALTRVPADIMLLPGWDWPAMGYTHTMKMARLRAIENGYSLIRVDYDGTSGAFDPYGRELARQDTVPGRTHTVIVDMPARRVPTVYGHIGDVFAWLCVATALGLSALGVLRPAKRTRHDSSGPNRDVSHHVAQSTT